MPLRERPRHRHGWPQGASLHSERHKDSFGYYVRVWLTADSLGKIACQPIAGIRIRINPAGRSKQEIRFPCMDAVSKSCFVVRPEHWRFVVKAGGMAQQLIGGELADGRIQA